MIEMFYIDLVDVHKLEALLVHLNLLLAEAIILTPSGKMAKILVKMGLNIVI